MGINYHINWLAGFLNHQQYCNGSIAAELLLWSSSIAFFAASASLKITTAEPRVTQCRSATSPVKNSQSTTWAETWQNGTNSVYCIFYCQYTCKYICTYMKNMYTYLNILYIYIYIHILYIRFIEYPIWTLRKAASIAAFRSQLPGSYQFPDAYNTLLGPSSHVKKQAAHHALNTKQPKHPKKWKVIRCN